MIPYGRQDIQSQDIEAVIDVLRSDFLTQGPAVPRFEKLVAEKVGAVYGHRWTGDFDVGCRGPLFWIDDGIDREGCQVAEDGMICYSDRAGRGFAS